VETQWSKWLRQLESDNKGGIAAPGIQRGGIYTLPVWLPWDASAETFTAQITLSPDGDGPISFAVDVGSYSDGFTLVTLSLTAMQTTALAPDGDGDGLSEVLFDLLRDDGVQPEYRLFGGVIPISGQISEYGA